MNDKEEFDIIVDIEDIFNSIIKNNPDLTPSQRVVVWEACNKAIEDIINESERVTCLDV